jgi:hypothetical protein
LQHSNELRAALKELACAIHQCDDSSLLLEVLNHGCDLLETMSELRESLVRNEIKLLVSPIKSILQDSCTMDIKATVCCAHALVWMCASEQRYSGQPCDTIVQEISSGTKTYNVLLNYFKIIMSFFRVGTSTISKLMDHLCDYRSLIELHVCIVQHRSIVDRVLMAIIVQP